MVRALADRTKTFGRSGQMLAGPQALPERGGGCKSLRIHVLISFVGSGWQWFIRHVQLEKLAREARDKTHGPIPLLAAAVPVKFGSCSACARCSVISDSEGLGLPQLMATDQFSHPTSGPSAGSNAANTPCRNADPAALAKLSGRALRIIASNPDSLLTEFRESRIPSLREAPVRLRFGAAEVGARLLAAR